MPKLGALTSGDQQKLEIPVADGEIVHIVMSPGKLTGERVFSVTGATDEAESFTLIIQLLADVVDSWDITDDDDNELPVNVESINKLPLGFIMSVFTAMQTVANPPTPSGKSFTSG